MIQVYTGDGKGKTTAAMGLALRALGWGWRVLVIQFLKKGHWGELRALERFGEQVRVVQVGAGGFVKPETLTKHRVSNALGVELALLAKRSREFDMVILDELNQAVNLGVVPLEKALEIVDGWPEDVELVITGRCAPEELVARADLVTEMREVKHYFKRGVKARRGIEF